MRTRKQKIILVAKVIAVTLLVLIIAFFTFRNVLLQQAIRKISHKMNRDYNCAFSVKEARFVGFSGLYFSNVILVPKKTDTLFNIHKIETSVSISHLLIDEIQLGT